MTSVHELEAAFCTAVAGLQAAKERSEQLRDESALAICELARARDIHEGARNRFLDAVFYEPIAQARKRGCKEVPSVLAKDAQRFITGAQ